MKAGAFGGRLRLVVYGWGFHAQKQTDKIGPFVNSNLNIINLGKLILMCIS